MEETEISLETVGEIENIVLEREDSTFSSDDISLYESLEESSESYDSINEINIPAIPSRRVISSEKLENIWTLSYNGDEIKVLFPKSEDLVEVGGILINIGDSNISGVVVGSSFNTSTYFRNMVTILPLASSNSQSRAYSNGSHSYFTVYSESGYQGLTTTNYYADFPVVDHPKYGATFSRANIIIIALLFASLLVSFIGGIFRKS